MEANTITIHWHDENSPIYSVDFQASENNKSPRFATGGGDNNIRLWDVQYTPFAVNYLSTLSKHTQAVNAVKFDRTGNLLASAGDDGSLIIWKRSDTIVKEFGSEDDDDAKESWIAKNILRSSTSEIYDISWSPDSKFIATGSMDNITRVYSVEAPIGQVFQLNEHSHYVQGVAWDPLGKYLATQSADRSVNVYELMANNEPKLLGKSQKANFSIVEPSTASHTPDRNIESNSIEPDSTLDPIQSVILAATSAAVASTSTTPIAPIPKKSRTSLLYHSETLQSFFRRLTFSPDGSLLLAPSGVFKPDGEESEETNTIYIYTRAGLGKGPVCHIPGMKKPAIAISFSPIKYTIDKSESEAAFQLPYKMVFAVATQDSVIVYDTVNLKPLGYASNLHYSTITDLVWNKDGQSIIVSSTDGFCSSIIFKEGIFGKKENREGEELRVKVKEELKKESKEEHKEEFKEEHKEEHEEELMEERKEALKDIKTTPIEQFVHSTKISIEQKATQPTNPSIESSNVVDKNIHKQEVKEVPTKKRRIQPILIE
ncbi:chromatin assembly factor 1 subunit p60 [[Candida] anglica]|uniref:Chromatin assembly factor 1 subunit p60 n=1 Tax=[Candida] anglica TaxID=148631 RepID=A0ABP0ED51_9ASCO